MTKLLEYREYIRAFYMKYQRYLTAVCKLLLGFSVFYAVSAQIGYAAWFRNPLCALGLGVLCMLLPYGMISVLAVLLIELQLFLISLEVGLTALVFLIFMLLLYLAMKPGNGVLIAVMLLLCIFNGSGIAAIPIGVVCSPLALLPVVFGMVLYSMISVARNNYSILSSQSTSMSSLEKIGFFLQQVISDRRTWMLLTAVAVTIFLVYLLRRMSVSYAWSLSIASGAGSFVLIVLMGNFIFGISANALPLLISCLLGVLIGVGIHFFRFLLDHSKTEYLQYEDDEYYYYVKAVPKLSVSVEDKQIKNITQKEETEQEEF